MGFRTVNPAPSQTLKVLTLRSILTGCVIGAILTPCNVYSGLKIGWTFNMSIAAALISYAFWSVMQRGLGTAHWGVGENTINQTAASAAASIISAGLVAPIPALTILTGQSLTWPILALWSFVVSFTGVVVAIGLRRQMLIIDELPFPSGIATAETLKEIYSTGQEALSRVKMLLGFGGLAAGLKLTSDFLIRIPKAHLPSTLNFKLKGLSLSNLGFVLDPSLLMVGFGMIIGLRAGISLLLGALISWGLLAPWALSQGWVDVTAQGERALMFNELVEWLLWPGVALMVAASLTSFVFSVVGMWRRRAGEQRTPADPNEISRRWFWTGILLSLIMAGFSQILIFDIKVHLAILAVLLTFVLAVVSCRVSGETGIPPIGALGKITQLIFGLLNPGNMVSNLMTANVTGGAAGQSSDLLHDMKTGLLMGVAPKLQTIAQLFGIFTGALVGTAAYLILIPDPKALLLTEEWPAPAVATWKAVAEVFAAGPEAIPTGSVTAMIIALGLGILMATLERRGYKRYLPSAASLGLAFIIPAWNSISMCLGAVIVALLARYVQSWSRRFVLVMAAGLVAGESLAGIASAIAGVLGI